MDLQQTNDASSFEENTNEPFCNSNPIESCKTDVTNDTNSMKPDVAIRDDDANDKGISDDNKAETIKALKEEIDWLKAKITEFEAECPDKVNAYKSTTIVDQSESGRVRPWQRDSLRSYTPQIRYTKLEFKVDTFFAVGSPLGVFLSLRNIRIGIGEGKEYWKEENINGEMPACR